MHWNFFVTLAMIPLISTIQSIIAPKIPRLGLALGILCFYQYFLSQGLQDYIVHAPRIDFVSQNREGLCSLFGTDIFLDDYF